MREVIPDWKSVGGDDSNEDTLVGKIATFLFLPILGGVVGFLIGLRIFAEARPVDGYETSKRMLVIPTVIGAVVGFVLSIWAFVIVARDRAKHRRRMANHIDSDI